MQAPKVTLFDGQIATISDQSQQPFVTSITPVVGDFAVAQQPVIVVLNEGTQLNVQGIVSDDKRFVRLTLVPFFSQIGDVDTFTFEGSRTTRRSSREEEDTNGDGVVNEDDAVNSEDELDIISGSTVQLPTFAFTQVSTTVSVPDGGTILLGGIKRLSEGRTERGVPMLSKIPYISRLFRNVAVGRDATSLMLMVTPRIIIQEEEEFAQTGFQPNR
jgi:general secretion pathway protein D